MKTNCTCGRCVLACELCPGFMSPEDATRAMDAGLAKRLMLDWMEPCEELGYDFDEIHILAAASRGFEGRRAPSLSQMRNDPKYGLVKGWCTFLKESRCELHDSGYKPLQCRDTFACVPDSGSDNYAMARLWNSDEGRAVVARWHQEVSK